MLRKQSAFVFAIAVAALAPLFYGSAAQAQATRTWVSGLGDDANPCSRTAPCKTFAGAISKTAVGGIINCLDPAGYGTVTITKSITIDCRHTLGGVLASGITGINIVTANVVVNLRGLDIEGTGTGTIGVNVTANATGSTVHVEECKIFGFQSGNAIGINYAGSGILVVNNTHLHTNGTGIVLNGANGPVNMNLRDVIADQNSSNGILVTSAGQFAVATVDRTTLAFNGIGLRLNGAGTIAFIGNSTVVGNGTGVAGGTVQSFKNNQIAGNGTDGTPIPAFPGPGGPLQ